jgi:tRNA A37 methylthiotransferase MiaB
MKIACVTLGYRTNQHDTAEMQTLLGEEGFSIVKGREKVDTYGINTCRATQHRDERSPLAVKKSLAINPNALNVIVGFPGDTQIANQKTLKIREKILGQQETVLIENQRDTKSGWLKGHTGKDIPIILGGDDTLKNNLIPVTLQSVPEHQVAGCLL